MVIPGYDPDDIDERLEELLSEHELDEYLTTEERARYDDGTSLVDLLSGDEIRDLLGENPKADG